MQHRNVIAVGILRWQALANYSIIYTRIDKHWSDPTVNNRNGFSDNYGRFCLNFDIKCRYWKSIREAYLPGIVATQKFSNFYHQYVNIQLFLDRYSCGLFFSPKNRPAILKIDQTYALRALGHLISDHFLWNLDVSSMNQRLTEWPQCHAENRGTMANNRQAYSYRGI